MENSGYHTLLPSEDGEHTGYHMVLPSEDGEHTGCHILLPSEDGEQRIPHTSFKCRWRTADTTYSCHVKMENSGYHMVLPIVDGENTGYHMGLPNEDGKQAGYHILLSSGDGENTGYHILYQVKMKNTADTTWACQGKMEKSGYLIIISTGVQIS
jgi:hypothetical protein